MPSQDVLVSPKIAITKIYVIGTQRLYKQVCRFTLWALNELITGYVIHDLHELNSWCIKLIVIVELTLCVTCPVV